MNTVNINEITGRDMDYVQNSNLFKRRDESEIVNSFTEVLEKLINEEKLEEFEQIVKTMRENLTYQEFADVLNNLTPQLLHTSVDYKFCRIFYTSSILKSGSLTKAVK